KIFSVNDPRNVYVDVLGNDMRFYPPRLVLGRLFHRCQNRFRFFLAERRRRRCKNDEPALKQAFHHYCTVIADEPERPWTSRAINSYRPADAFHEITSCGGALPIKVLPLNQ